MKIPVDLFVSAIEEKKIYYFSSTKINTNEPHYFICIKKTDNDVLIMSCCTSKFETVRKFVESRCLPFETLVWITPSDLNNPFTMDTYVNCNDTIPFTIEEFRIMYDSDSITSSGEISLNHYSQILTGIHKSPMIDDEIKELIPNPESL